MSKLLLHCSFSSLIAPSIDENTVLRGKSSIPTSLAVGSCRSSCYTVWRFDETSQSCLLDQESEQHFVEVHTTFGFDVGLPEPVPYPSQKPAWHRLLEARRVSSRSHGVLRRGSCESLCFRYLSLFRLTMRTNTGPIACIY